jgi:RNA polymerase sigma-70 factor (ECF subfamily)
MGMDREQRISDEEVVRRVLDGDRELFQLLVERYLRRLVRFLFRLAGDVDTAEDLAQQSLVKAYVALASFDPRYRFGTWLFRIAGNAAVDHLRRRRVPAVSLDRFPARPGEFRRLDPPSPGPAPDEAAGRRELRRTLERAVAALPPDYRRLVALRHGADLSYEEIVEVTGLPLGTVKNRLFRARAMLRKALAGRGPGEAQGGGE